MRPWISAIVANAIKTRNEFPGSLRPNNDCRIDIAGNGVIEAGRPSRRRKSGRSEWWLLHGFNRSYFKDESHRSFKMRELLNELHPAFCNSKRHYFEDCQFSNQIPFASAGVCSYRKQRCEKNCWALSNSHPIPRCFFSVFNENFLERILCRFVNMKTQFFRLLSTLLCPLADDSQCTGVKMSEMFRFAAKIPVRPFVWESDRWWNFFFAPKSGRPSCHTSENYFPPNYVQTWEQPETICESGNRVCSSTISRRVVSSCVRSKPFTPRSMTRYSKSIPRLSHFENANGISNNHNDGIWMVIVVSQGSSNDGRDSQSTQSTNDHSLNFASSLASDMWYENPHFFRNSLRILSFSIFWLWEHEYK
jgi:hypothetical protein